MTPRTDVCDKCERFCQTVTAAVTDEEKVAALDAFSNHLPHAQSERDSLPAMHSQYKRRVATNAYCRPTLASVLPKLGAKPLHI